MTVQDSTGTIHSDLILGASSVLEQNHATITGISFSSGTAVSLTDTQAELVLPALALLPASSLTVSNVSIANVPAIAALSSLTSMTVQDATGTIHTDLLKGANSVLEENAGFITGITYSSGIAIALTDSQAELVLAALATLPASSLTVSAVSIADLPAIGALSALSSMTVSDSAGNIKADLILDASSQLAAYHSAITGVTVTGGPISLTDAQALAAEATALALLPAAILDVTGVAVGDVAGVAGIGAPLASMTVSDTATAHRHRPGAGCVELRTRSECRQDLQHHRNRRAGGAERCGCLGGDGGAGAAGCPQPDDQRRAGAACRDLRDVDRPDLDDGVRYGVGHL